MKKVILVLTLLVLMLSVFASDLAYSPREIIVKLQDSRANLDLDSLPLMSSWVKSFGVKKISPLTSKNNNQYYVIETNKEIPLSEIEAKSTRFSEVEYIQPNYLNVFHNTTNDPFFYQQQHGLCNIPEAWTYTTGDEDIIIAVVDSGILYEHPDLTNIIYNNENEIANSGNDDDNNGYIDDYRGWDFTDAPTLDNIALGDYTERENDASDENYHGTHVSGIIGAEVNNGVGIAGVVWNANILPIRAGFRTTSGGGYLQDDDVSAAIIYATDMGADIINMSWGSSYYSAIIADACQYAYDRGVILVASSGNDPGPFISYPARLSTVFSVGSVDRTKTLSSFSSYGPELDIVAPGSQVISTYSMDGSNDGYAELSGTSMAAPYAAGIMGLLLSQRPGTTFDELKTMLYETAEYLPLNSIQTNGFNQQYGYGLINAYNLLSTYTASNISITYPYEEMGLSSSFTVKGKINIDDFFRYSVTYSPGSETEDLVWKDCFTHGSTPLYIYSNEVSIPFEGDLHEFQVEPEMLDGRYRIRLSVQNNSGKTYNILRNVYIDKSIPQLRSDFEIVTRYRSNNKQQYIKCHFNESVNVQASIYASNNQQFSAFSETADSLLFVPIPNNVSSGLISVEINAQNRSGLNYYSGLLPDLGEIDHNSTPINNFVVSPLMVNEIIPTKKIVDFDDNGKNEFIAMDIENGTFGNVAIYEQNSEGFAVKFQFNDKFRPLDIGDSNNSGYEVVGLNLETLYIYETYGGSNYPLNSYIQSIANGSGAIFADYNNNGRDDLICVINEPAQTVVKLYQRQLQEFVEKERLVNSSSTFARNTFVPWVKCANLDGDNYQDILTADTDGDVMIFEINDNADSYLTWSDRVSVRNAYYLDYGDFTGDGSNEFIVGGYVENLENMNNTYFEFNLYKSDGNNSYQIIDTISFDNVDKNNSLVIYDLDGDGKDEMYLSLTPYLYKVEYLDGKLTPTAVHNSSNSFQISFYQADSNSPSMLLCNQIIDGTPQSVYLTTRDYHNEPATPSNFEAVPIDESHALLTWEADGLSSYKIYSLIEGVPTLLSTTNGGSYTVEQLQVDTEYKFAVSTYNDNFDNAESYLTPWKTVIPNLQPRILNVRKIGDFSVEVIFNVPLSNEMIRVGHYSFDGGIGNPHSVILDTNFTRAIVRLRQELINPQYTLTCSSILSQSNILAETLSASFDNVEDVIAPTVEIIDIVSRAQVKLTFSENIFSQDFQAVTISNFTLKNPPNDVTTKLLDILHHDNEVIINFSNELQYGNNPYKLIINNIIDSNGNVVLPQLSTIHFNLTDITDLSKLVVYPNPTYLRNGDNEINLTNFPLNSRGKISIYTKSGDLVFTKKIGPFYGVDNFSWDLKNNNGQKVSSGVYFYVINMGDSEKKGKIAVLN